MWSGLRVSCLEALAQRVRCGQKKGERERQDTAGGKSRQSAERVANEEERGLIGGAGTGSDRCGREHYALRIQLAPEAK